MKTREVLDHPYLLELTDNDTGARFVLHLDMVQYGSSRSLSAGLLFRCVERTGQSPVWRVVPKEGPTYRAILQSQRHLCERVADLQPDPEQPNH